MSVEKIIQLALEEKPVDMKKEFNAEMDSRVTIALEAYKKKKMSENDDEDEPTGNGDICPHCKGRGYHEDENKKVECEPCNGTGKKLDADAEDPKGDGKQEASTE